MHTTTRSAEKCWPILLWTAWRLSFEGIQYAQSFEGIQHARVLVSCISIRLVRTFSLRCLFHLIIFLPSSKTVSLRCSFCFHVDSNRATPHASNESRFIRISRHSLHTDSNNRTVPVASRRVARNASFVQLKKKSLRCYHICFCGPSAITPIWAS